jgi:hypothetical protein
MHEESRKRLDPGAAALRAADAQAWARLPPHSEELLTVGSRGNPS